MEARKHIAWLLLALICATFGVQSTAYASPFGQGVFGADVPFGSATSISIALGNNVSFSLAAAGNSFAGSGTHTLTVTTTDVVGYQLYAHSQGSANMTNGADTIPASANVSAAPLSLNTWGYNTDGSTNFKGMTLSNSLIKQATGPYKNGDPTTLTYGARTDITKSAGSYTVNVVYDAVATVP